MEYSMDNHKAILAYIKRHITEKPVFIMMVGIAGSGKTAVANKLINHFKQLNETKDKTIKLFSSDSLREELLGDINDQSQNNIIFEEMRKRTISTLKEKKSVIYDATNLTIKDRRKILNIIKDCSIDCDKIAYIIPSTIATCLVNGTNRNRVVSYDVLQKMIHRFQIPIYQEGFDFIGVEGYTPIDFCSTFCWGHNVVIKSPWLLLSDMENFNQENHHHRFSLLSHSILTYEKILRTTRKFDENNTALEYAALLHDFGKTETKIRNDKGECSYYGHANVGAYNLLQKLRQLDLHKYEDVLYCIALINYHMEPFGWENANYNTIEKKQKFFGDKMYNDLLLLHKADKYAAKGEIENEKQIMVKDRVF